MSRACRSVHGACSVCCRWSASRVRLTQQMQGGVEPSGDLGQRQRPRWRPVPPAAADRAVRLRRPASGDPERGHEPDRRGDRAPACLAAVPYPGSRSVGTSPSTARRQPLRCLDRRELGHPDALGDAVEGARRPTGAHRADAAPQPRRHARATGPRCAGACGSWLARPRGHRHHRRPHWASPGASSSSPRSFCCSLSTSETAGNLSLAVSLPTMLVAFARYSPDGSLRRPAQQPRLRRHHRRRLHHRDGARRPAPGRRAQHRRRPRTRPAPTRLRRRGLAPPVAVAPQPQVPTAVARPSRLTPERR
jgi:hypothetical protein